MLFDLAIAAEELQSKSPDADEAGNLEPVEQAAVNKNKTYQLYDQPAMAALASCLDGVREGLAEMVARGGRKDG